MILLPIAFFAPLFAFLILNIMKSKLTVNQITAIAVVSMVLSFAATLATCYSYFHVYHLGSVLKITIGGWLHIGDYTPTVSLGFDGLSLVMLMLISFIGLMIHLFCSWSLPQQLAKTFSEQQQVCTKYASYISKLSALIVAMLLLVLADNLLVLYLAWEAVTLITFLLLNFDSPKVGKRLRKYATQPSFIPNRIANSFLAVGFFVLAKEFGTINILQIITNAPLYYSQNHPSLIIAVASIVVGAMGLSAQLPLHTWLLNLNASKTPSSIIIVASLVVTLGVYLLARLQPLLILTPDILFWWVGLIGAISMIVGAISALAQTNIKRLLVFASISQVGFMFIGMGVGAWQSSIFHLVCFGFFQGLLLLAMGCLLKALKYKSNMLKMGQLKASFPLIFWGFIFGSAGLTAFPFISGSFYSLQGILFQAHSQSYDVLYSLILFGIALTALYTWRMLWLIFYKQPQQKVKINQLKGKVYRTPLIILMLLSTSVSVLLSPQLTNVLADILPPDDIEYLLLPNEYLQTIDSGGISMLMTLLGIMLAWGLYTTENSCYVKSFTQSRFGSACYKLAHQGLGVATLYEYVFIRPLFALDNWLTKQENKEQHKDEEKEDVNPMIKALSTINHGLLDMQGGSLRGYFIALLLGLITTAIIIQGVF